MLKIFHKIKGYKKRTKIKVFSGHKDEAKVKATHSKVFWHAVLDFKEPKEGGVSNCNIGNTCWTMSFLKSS